MRLSKSVFFLILIYGLLNASPAGVKTAGKKKILPVEEFVSIACRNDTVFQKILIDELYLNYKKDLALPAKDIILSIKGQYDFVIDSGIGSESDNETSGTISLSKLFPYTGTEISTEYSTYPQLTDSGNSSSFILSVSQPIAKNAFGKTNRLLEKITGIEIDLMRHQITEAYEDYLAAVMNLYFKWYSAYENLKAGEASYNYNLKILNNIRKKRMYDVAHRLDVNKINLQVASKEENLIILRDNFKQALNLVKHSIKYNEDKELIPQRPVLYKDKKISFDKDYALFKATSRTYKILNLIERKGALDIDKAVDDLLPSANLVAGYSIEGSGYTIKNGENRVFAGFTFDFPFWGQKENARRKYANIDLKKARLSSSGKKIQLESYLQNLQGHIERVRELIAVARRKVELSRKIVADETRNYTYGKILLNDLISAINSLEDNRFNWISHTIELNTLIVEWQRMTDRLILHTVKRRGS